MFQLWLDDKKKKKIQPKVKSKNTTLYESSARVGRQQGAGGERGGKMARV